MFCFPLSFFPQAASSFLQTFPFQDYNFLFARVPALPSLVSAPIRRPSLRVLQSFAGHIPGSHPHSGKFNLRPRLFLAIPPLSFHPCRFPDRFCAFISFSR